MTKVYLIWVERLCFLSVCWNKKIVFLCNIFVSLNEVNGESMFYTIRIIKAFQNSKIEFAFPLHSQTSCVFRNKCYM